MSRISFLCTRLTHFNKSYFWYKDRTLSILTFSNRSVKLFTLKNCFPKTVKALLSIRMCLTVQVVCQVKHCGCGSCFRMKEWVNLVWPIRNRDITTCFLLDFLNADLHSPKVGWIWKSLLWMLLLYHCCHFVCRNLLIVVFRSVYGILDLLGVRFKAGLWNQSQFEAVEDIKRDMTVQVHMISKEDSVSQV